MTATRYIGCCCREPTQAGKRWQRAALEQVVRSIEGVVTIVQESRFQLVGDDGVAHMVVLGPHAGAEPDQLEALARGQRRVRVRVKDAPDAIGFVAQRLETI